MSGWRRMTPVAEQGASSSMRSKAGPSNQSAGRRASPRRNGGVQAEPRKILFKPRKPVAVDIKRHKFSRPRAQLQQLRALAAGGRAGVQNPHPGANAEQGRGQLRAGVLNRYQAFGKAGQPANRRRRIKPQGGGQIIRQAAAPGSGSGGQCPVRAAAASRAIDPQPHRGLAVSGPENRPPVSRPGGLQSADQPLGMRVPSLETPVGRLLQ